MVSDNSMIDALIEAFMISERLRRIAEPTTQIEKSSELYESLEEFEERIRTQPYLPNTPPIVHFIAGYRESLRDAHEGLKGYPVLFERYRSEVYEKLGYYPEKLFIDFSRMRKRKVPKINNEDEARVVEEQLALEFESMSDEEIEIWSDLLAKFDY